MKKSWLFLIVLSFCSQGYAQTGSFVYENRVYKPTIKTIQCYNIKKEQSVPIITLGSNEQILFSFDDLGKPNQDYSYTIEHCTSDWKPSRINPIDYLESFTEDRILDYRISFNTIQKYTHYEFTLPNYQVRPKIAGNYLLKVYQDGNPQKPVISQRIYVTNNLVNVGAELEPSSQVSDRSRNQKLNISVFHGFQIPNPYMDVKMVVMQNLDPLTAKINLRPSFIRQGSLLYNDLTSNDFAGGNEFRKFDFRSLKFKAENVKEIFRDSTNSVILYQDQKPITLKYASQFDENGAFFIRSNDGRNSNTEGDYANVFFTLSAPLPPENGSAYVVGRFNNYALTAENKLIYVDAKGTFQGSIQLKQGLYDYKYVWVSPGTLPDSSVFEGSFYETENNYQIFVYYRRPGARWDELVGYSSINSHRR